MKRIIVSSILAGALIIALTIPAASAPNLYGTSGLIEIPDDFVYPVGSVALAYHFVSTEGDDFSTFTAGFGVTPNFSVSGGVATNGDSEAIINAKYRLVPETVDRPSITIGVVDALEELSDDPGIYILVAKNLTAAAEEVAGGESKPLRGYLGFGTGVFDGIFFGLDWTLTPKLTAMLEYVSGDDGRFNGGIRIALSNELRLDAGLIDFDDFTAGISYNLLRF